MLAVEQKEIFPLAPVKVIGSDVPAAGCAELKFWKAFAIVSVAVPVNDKASKMQVRLPDHEAVSVLLPAVGASNPKM